MGGVPQFLKGGFVKAETLVQEITSDGRCQEIVTTLEKTKEQVYEEKLRQLPEFQREDAEKHGKAAGDLSVTLNENKRKWKEEQEKEKEYRISLLNEEEVEHLDAI